MTLKQIFNGGKLPEAPELCIALRLAANHIPDEHVKTLVLGIADRAELTLDFEGLRRVQYNRLKHDNT